MTKKKTTNQVVDELLDSLPPPKSKSIMSTKPELCAAVRRFMELKASGDPRAHVTLSWFYRTKLRAAYDGPSLDAVRRYVHDVLQLNTTTGNPL